MALESSRVDAVQSDRLENSDDPVGHVERVLTTAERYPALSLGDEVAQSWRRSANEYSVDPASSEAPQILTSAEVKDLREPLVQLVGPGQDEIDQLYSVVRAANYTVLLCNADGVAIDHRGNEAEADQFKYWGTWLGGVWAEGIEGTNGIGTCIIEERPISVHRSQHFRVRHIGLSCSGSPIFDPGGKLAAVLDVSSIDPQLSEQAHALTGALTEVAARAMEERWFRERFRRDWIVAIAPSGESGPATLFAVDRDHRVVGASRSARKLLERRNRPVQDGVSLWAIFEPSFALLRPGVHGDVAGSLVPIGTSESWSALITPPEAQGAWRNSETTRLHARPRLNLLSGFRPSTPPPRARGGLSPGALRRVKDYIDANLEKNIDVATLAGTAGLSVFHFARAFKQSEGVTPHGYLLDRRLVRAQKLLTTTNLSHAEIALAAGFADESHLARVFRQLVGMSPSTFRWSRR